MGHSVCVQIKAWVDQNIDARGGGPDIVSVLLFFVINVFHRGPYGPPLRSIWTQKGECVM